MVVTSRVSRQRWAHRVQVTEAMVLLTMGRLLQGYIPLARWSRLLGSPQQVPAAWRSGEQPIPVAAFTSAEIEVARAVRRASARLPWRSSCLAEATAAQVLLRRRGEPGAVVIGLRRPDQGTVPGWEAHAWLYGRSGAVTGGPAAAGFTATSLFSPVPDWSARHEERA